MDDETRRCFIGPIPVKEFFRRFLPARKLSEEDRTALPGFEAIAKAKENEVYNKFVRRFHYPAYFPHPIAVLSLGPRCEFMLFQD